MQKLAGLKGMLQEMPEDSAKNRKRAGQNTLRFALLFLTTNKRCIKTVKTALLSAKDTFVPPQYQKETHEK